MAAWAWTPKPPQWSQQNSSLLTETESIKDTPLNTLIQRSDIFPVKFPVDTNRCKTLSAQLAQQTLERNINSAYPLVHENILYLYSQYIVHKRVNGNSIEKSLYSNMTVPQFVDRLLTKRAVNFMGKYDSFILLNGRKGRSIWETIGTPQQKEWLSLRDNLSYEEIKLSAFLSVSSYTYFLNVGDRKNMAALKRPPNQVQDEGVIIGIIGPRLVKPLVMDYQELALSPSQNTSKNGYGPSSDSNIHRLFADLFEEDHLLEYDKVVKTNRYVTLQNGELLDSFLYYKRLLFTFDTLLIEANQRALDKGTSAFVHVVGIGLGVWKKSACQIGLFMKAFAARIKELGRFLHHVSDICFAYIPQDSCGGVKDKELFLIDGHPMGGIRIYINKREPHAKLKGKDKGKLLVVSYAWDGNALPGNEYWKGQLGGSGDSAAASSTQISELHNPFINQEAVSSKNLRVVLEATSGDGSSGGRVINYGDYVKLCAQKGKRGHSPEESCSKKKT